MIVQPNPESPVAEDALSLGPPFDRTAADPAAALVEAYTQYWLLPEDAPLEDYRRLHGEIRRAEAAVGPESAAQLLDRAARDFQHASGHCPFCRTRGALCSPTAQDQIPVSAGPEEERS